MASVWQGARRPRVSFAEFALSGGGDGNNTSSASAGTSTIPSGTTTTSSRYTTSSSTYSVRAGRRDMIIDPLSAPAMGGKAEVDEEESYEVRARKIGYMKGLVVEFCGDDVGAVKRCLMESGLGWVLKKSSPDMFYSWKLRDITRNWVLLLLEIVKSISRCFQAFDGSRREEAAAWPPASEFVRFFQAILVKMLRVCALIIARNQGDVDDLQALLHVRDALYKTSDQILMSLCPTPPNEESTRRIDDMRGLLSAELDKLDKAIWDTMDRIRTGIILSSKDDDDGSISSSSATQTSPEIHKVTRSIMDYIKALWSNYESVERVLQQRANKYASEDRCTGHLINLILEMVDSSQEKLARESQALRDHSLRFLFLINNSNFIWQHLHTVCPLHELTGKVDGYIQSYLEESWMPVLKCLDNPALCCSFIIASPLQKFESKFLQTCATQKLWKIPDPAMRRRLRKAISEKVTSEYTKYLEDNNIVTPSVTPEQLEEMLQELFEG